MSGQAGAKTKKPKVTAEMISAGLAALKAEAGDDFRKVPLHGQIVAKVFVAMVAASTSKLSERLP